MITVHKLAIRVNTPEDAVLARVSTLCKEWGEDEVIVYAGGNGSKTTELTNRAAEMIERMTRLGLTDRLPVS